MQKEIITEKIIDGQVTVTGQSTEISDVGLVVVSLFFAIGITALLFFCIKHS